jgi:hypothetical protein
MNRAQLTSFYAHFRAAEAFFGQCPTVINVDDDHRKLMFKSPNGTPLASINLFRLESENRWFIGGSHDELKSQLRVFGCTVST